MVRGSSTRFFSSQDLDCYGVCLEFHDASPTASLQIKLHPGRYSGMPPLLAARMAPVVGHVLGIAWTTPCFAKMIVLPDNFVFAQTLTEDGPGTMVGWLNVVQQDWKKLLDKAGLTDEERAVAEARFEMRLLHWTGGKKRHERPAPCRTS